MDVWWVYFLIERALDIQTEHVFLFSDFGDPKGHANLCGAGDKRCR